MLFVSVTPNPPAEPAGVKMPPPELPETVLLMSVTPNAAAKADLAEDPPHRP